MRCCVVRYLRVSLSIGQMFELTVSRLGERRLQDSGGAGMTVSRRGRSWMLLQHKVSSNAMPREPEGLEWLWVC